MTDTTIVIGDRVRSFDFESRDLTGERADYMEGEVVGVQTDAAGIERYTILVNKIVWRGEEQLIYGLQFSYPPINGIPKLLGGVTDGVVKLP